MDGIRKEVAPLPQAFRHCPRCGSAPLTFNGKNRYRCSTCGFTFYQNTAAACGVILRYGDRVLLLERAVDPARGMFDFPGGFVDPGESIEEALRREVTEEIGIDVHDLRYFTSGPNVYRHLEVAYPTCDLVFTGRIAEPPRFVQESEIAGYCFLLPVEIDTTTIAFPSLRAAMERYIERVR